MEVVSDPDFVKAWNVEEWFTPPSGATGLSAAAASSMEQSSTTPPRWIPCVLASALLASVCPNVLARADSSEHRGTSPYIAVLAEPHDVSETAVAGSLRIVEESLGLTRSQLAEALRVERPTLYQWLRGSQPRQGNLARLTTLRSIASDWDDVELGSASSAWSMRFPGESSLAELLTAEEIDFDAIRLFMRHLRDTPEAMEFVEPKEIYGFPAESELEERRRRASFFPPLLSDSD